MLKVQNYFRILKLKKSFSLTFSNPGSPIIIYNVIKYRLAIIKVDVFEKLYELNSLLYFLYRLENAEKVLQKKKIIK